jgi:hypothetical protein
MITFAKIPKLPVAEARLFAVATAWAMAIVLTLPFAATAEPIQLKLAFFGSEETLTYLSGIKPFVDGVNAEGQGIIKIRVYPGGALGKAIADQPQLVIDGVADIAYVIPGQTPYRFPDNGLLEQPGIFRDAREGTLAYTRLIAAGALRGYQDFFVIGAYTAAPNFIHSREPIPISRCDQGTKASRKQCNRGGGNGTPRGRAERSGCIEGRQRNRQGRARWHQHESDGTLRVQRGACGEKSLPPAHRRRPAALADEP